MLEDGMEKLWRIAGLSFGAALIYRFEGFELDPGKFELREHGHAKHLEPQVLSLLILLASNADRLVSKDEIIEKIWGGRIVSEAAVASRVKAARQALGDDGKEQRFIRTIHGKGFRFGAPVLFEQAPGPVRRFAAPAADPSPPNPRRRGAALDRGAPLSSRWRSRSAVGRRRRAGRRVDQRSVADALAARDRAHLDLPLSRTGGELRTGRRGAGCALLPDRDARGSRRARDPVGQPCTNE